ncbi:E3 ubiquitin/ISG15 ligase TRIM25-like isoform X2 [Ruditapes philippinarum]|uniref:E3 ubiquitin/ISG15 ligase TRIM25-like isoform X2 n=1 Tax=Ruditapes philippinarum TaxID=129788 RepID=UPI00295AE4FD|nr:E3 ubiquitin/ISG15 ligase TRIM25-like isoform X2 [Ruditapes philippinarum]
MATGDSEMASDEFSDFQCFTCTGKVAVKYCVECQGYCCQSCMDTHLRFPALKSHTLLDPSTGKVEGSLISLPTQRCSIHSIKLVDMYCKDHDEVGCTTCMALKHRSCINVHSIPDDIDTLFSTKDLADINRGLENTTKRFENIELKKEEALVGLNLSRKKADMKIDTEKQELITNLENIARQSKEDLRRKYETAKDEIEKDRQSAKEFKDGFRKLTTEFETSAGNKSQQFVCMNIAKRKIKEGKDSLSDFKCNGEASVSFHVDSGILKFSRDTKIFGRVKSTIGTSHHYTVETVKDMNVKLQDDGTTCDISGSCLIRWNAVIS